MRRFFLMGLVFLCFACVSVPKEAPKLSQELGNQLNDLEQSHLALVHRFFDGEREKVRHFIDDQWLPLFAKNFFQQPAIDQAWQQVVSSGSKNDRLQFILRTAPELQQQTNKKYQEFTLPLNSLENKLEYAIRQKYASAQGINQTLTAYLSSASKVAATRQNALNEVGISQAQTQDIIDQTAHFTNEALQGAQTIQAMEAQLEALKQHLNDLLSNF